MKSMALLPAMLALTSCIVVAPGARDPNTEVQRPHESAVVLPESTPAAAVAHYYYYFPDQEVYFDTKQHVYFYRNSHGWRRSVNPPQNTHLGDRRVMLVLHDTPPYRNHHQHRDEYPPQIREVVVAPQAPVRRQIPPKNRLHHYYYYPDAQVYLDDDRHAYFYREGNRWVEVGRVPSYIKLDARQRVAIVDANPRPYENHAAHVQRHPPANLHAAVGPKQDRSGNANRPFLEPAKRSAGDGVGNPVTKQPRVVNAREVDAMLADTHGGAQQAPLSQAGRAQMQRSQAQRNQAQMTQAQRNQRQISQAQRDQALRKNAQNRSSPPVAQHTTGDRAASVNVAAPLPGKVHAPAVKQKLRQYLYYPKAQVYFDVASKAYFYRDHNESAWKKGSAPPKNTHLKNTAHVALSLATEKPYELHSEHMRRFPAN